MRRQREKNERGAAINLISTHGPSDDPCLIKWLHQLACANICSIPSGTLQAAHKRTIRKVSATVRHTKKKTNPTTHHLRSYYIPITISLITGSYTRQKVISKEELQHEVK
uniref:Uncharacterized protein n=1 Tax=Trypanosoma congolense (strain IL3000) TaxID=1068625 RepID=G0USB6_TRYCI|nr:hypothetical protein, unlikely [Trypanosoma congolense IL3000]